jgi:UDP-N-acetylglucosamine/UDP-N-acetylgalactosamine diphosphorylase
MFIFDVFEFSERMGALEIPRSEEFSPLKNAPGSKSDSPETCRSHLSALHKKWLIAAGAKITNKDGTNLS